MKKVYSVAFASFLALTACGEQEKPESEKAQNVKEQAAEMEQEKSEPTMATDNETVAVVATTESGVSINNPVVNPTLPGQKVSSAFFNIKNASDKDIEITSISSDASKVTEFHTMEMKDSKMIMRQIEKMIIAAGTDFTMAPGADHVMLIELEKPLEPGEKVTFDLELNNGEKISFTTDVQDIKSHKGHEGHDHEGHEGHDHEGHEGHDHEGHEGHDHEGHDH